MRCKGLFLFFFSINIISELYKEKDFRIRPAESIKFIHYYNIFNLLPLSRKKGPFGGILLTINLIL